MKSINFSLISIDDKYQAVSGGLLLVHNVDAVDSYATYRCRVLHTLTAATAVSNTARIIVQGELLIVSILRMIPIYLL